MARPFRFMLALCLLLALVACDDVEITTDDTSDAAASVAPTRTRTPRRTPTPDEEQVSRTSDADTAWTVLVYLDGDNDLEAAAVNDFSEMARVGSNSDLNIIVQLDRVRADEDWDSTAYGNWQTAKRFRVERTMRPTKANELEDLGEVNMGDPDTLVDFVTWGVENYPAQRYALIFWDHGASWSGIANDDSSDGDLLTLPELTSAFKTIRKQTGIERFDLLGLDACLMSQLDVLEVLAPYGDVAVASADLEPAEGWAWDSWLKSLADDPSQDGAAISHAIVNSYMAFYRREKDPSVTLSAFDLRQVGAISQRFDELSGALHDDLADGYKAVGKARTYAGSYAADDNDYSAIDLGHFTQLIANESSNDQVIAAARALDQAIADARIEQGNGKDHPNGTGLTFYFPRKQKYYDDGYADQSVLAQQSDWDDFLTAYYGAGKRGARDVAATEPVVSEPVANTDAPSTMTAQVSGADTAYVYYLVGQHASDDPDRVLISYVDYIYPPGAAVVGSTPTWSSDTTDVSFQWKATSWYLSNGKDVIDLPLAATDYGSNIYSADGTYTDIATGDEIPVTIEFEVAQGRGTLVHVWGMGSGDNDVPQLYEIEPAAGNTFTPDITTYSPNDAEDADVLYVGGTISFGNHPLVAAEGPAQNGAYVVGLMVEDVHGDTTQQFSDVAVENENTEVSAEDIASVPVEDQTPAQSDGGEYAYEDASIGLRFAYPDAWTSADAAANKIVVYEDADDVTTSVAVDVSARRGADADERALDRLLDAEQALPDFAESGDREAVTLAGIEGMSISYTYSRDDQTMHVSAIAVSSEQTGLTYLVTTETDEASLNQQEPVFVRLLASFEIEH